MNTLKEEETIFVKLQEFCKINEQFNVTFKLVEQNIKVEKCDKINLLLNYISLELLHVPQYFNDIVQHFLPELPRLVITCLSQKENNRRLILNCIILSKVLKIRTCISGYALNYFKSSKCPFEEEIRSSTKCRKMDNSDVNDLELVESIYFLVKSNPEFYRSQWNWSNFIRKYMNHDSIQVIWISCYTVSIIFGMNENQLERLILSKMSNEVAQKLASDFDINQTLLKSEKSSIAINQNPIITKDYAINVANISGIYVQTIAKNIIPVNNLLEVESTSNNLRKLALALSFNKAICLQGPVGSGKTSLVEYLAAKTGRKLGENFVKVQLGDQTDSKMLLGTYSCTDIPGEFVWQPGILTQAILKGYWLLLEDIDLSSMDIASVLTSLLENQSLTVPGYRDSVSITPGFQLFVTQRLISTVTGHHKKHSNAISLLEKHLFQINVDPLTPDELKQILENRYEQFRTITDRMINVFLLFTKDIKTSSKSGRLISTRDFFKWCSRASIDFDVSSQASALKVLQEAIDIFCASYADENEALTLAMDISTQLGIINQKAEFFLKSYKPVVQLTTNSLITGRSSMKRENNMFSRQVKFSFTRPSAVLLERIMCCVNLNEPVLLVGETGTGKTSSIQYLASTIGQKLIVINMNQQSDSADLLGGYKPVDMKFIVAPIRQEFESIFCDYFKIEPNKKYLSNIALCFNNQRWSDLVKLMTKSYQAAVNRLTTDVKQSEQRQDLEKCQKTKLLLKRWESVGEKLHKLHLQIKQEHSLAFAFIEGSLVKAVEKGYWVLLDEINLANAETLECLSGLLEGSKGSLCLLERGDKQPVKRHKNFTLFACMNPSTDVGKKDLPSGLRNRFTEFFVHELTDKTDLLLLVNNYLEAMSLKDKELNKIVEFYLKVRKETITSLSDGLGHKPHYSLRSLCRALMIASKNPCGVFKRSLFEAFCLSFLTQLDANSYQIVKKMIAEFLIGDEKSFKTIMKQPIPEPEGGNYLQFEGYWVQKGSLEPSAPEEYILTESVRRNLKDLVRVVSIGKLPVLLQGDTSVGKTSLITYLAKTSGNKCVRINNHEHTDLQEYIGSYVADAAGKLVFREGLLVEAMRKGHWIILDELNLAPTDVLEALNRVLDDNRELFIPETQETVKADPNFMLFATQNPPGAYGGRKILSRAFRNRFVELHFNEIPAKELEVILHQRCQMPLSYAKKMINVMTDLQMVRKGSAAFAGKQGFITLRDLFRWGERYRLAEHTKNLYDWDQHLADEGYLVLAGRVRRQEEKAEITKVLKKHMKREVVPNHLFTLSDETSSVTRRILQKIYDNTEKHPNIVWTFNMRQLAVLVAKALEFKEPVLLVGETGGGKTTVCKLLAENNNQELVTVNCHMHTESSDFIGGLRPVRDHTDDANKLFEWVDGPLIKAMTEGSVFLADEISLADDSVLERLNSLLEPERSLLMAEKGIDLNNIENSELLTANPNFYFIGTMNPGGDFGKKELSPALRNRFTEIWCDSCTDRNDLIEIIEKNIKSGISFGNQQDGSSGIGNCIMDFVEWFQNTEIGKRFTVSIRDILTWVSFVNVCSKKKIDVGDAYLHGASLTFLDSLGSGVSSAESLKTLDTFKTKCETFLISQITTFLHNKPSLTTTSKVIEDDTRFGVDPFFILKNPEGEYGKENFSFNAPTTKFNTLCLIRGMQLNKAILLEGSPGVGKTSLVMAVARYTGHKLFRVNLSDQTDISDLFGADLPVEGGVGGQFSWRDGPLLQALKQGHWILLDELNLASQSVLEGLNACLDHRGEIFIPELGKTFHIKPGTRFFACQNPLKQGGSRRGLPKSFLNRFIQVYVHSLTDNDLNCVLSNQFHSIPANVLSKMVQFNSEISKELDIHSFGNKGGPWECNLRDLTRWCEAILYKYKENPFSDKNFEPECLVELIYSDRMRTSDDKSKVKDIFRKVFGRKIGGDNSVVYVNKDFVYLGDVRLSRDKSSTPNTIVLKQEKTCAVLRSQINTLRSLAYCVNLKWMSILVGSSGTGKSSVVKTLAHLSGKVLKTLPVTSAMDTTDILGGFEQTDYSRHLYEITNETKMVLLEILQELLINSKVDEVVRLLEYWESYLELYEDSNLRSMEEETKLFIRKLNKLESLWQQLENCSSSKIKNLIETLSNRSKTMRESVKNEGSLNAGGKFEWVDSLLTKCLKDGSWLLIDNVNLCSAAVLDRLNALLEPNGVLTLAERGVDSQGRMIQIKPHHDFRLFITMDPKNGEISRAMRNRGVEISIPNENDLNNFDLKSLIDLEGGLSDPHLIRVLLRIHNFLNDLILVDKPSVTDILQTALLVSQQINNGMSIFNALFTSTLDIYKSRLELSCNDSLDLLRSEIKKVLEEYVAEDDLYNSNVSLKTLNLQSISAIEKVKQQSAMISSILNNKNVDIKYTNILKYLLIYSYSLSSKEDLIFRHMYLKNILKNDILNLNIAEEFKQVVNIFNTPSNLPIDYRWLPDVKYPIKNMAAANKCILSLFMTNEFYMEHINLDKTKIVSKENKELTLYEYMEEKNKKHVSDKFHSVLINEFLELLKQFDKYIKEIPQKILHINDENTIQIFYCLTWRFILNEFSLQNIKNITSNQIYQIVMNLSVHYKWFFKYSIQKVCEITKMDLPPDLKQVLNTVNNSLEQQFALIFKISKNYHKYNNRPPPYINNFQLDAVQDYNSISNLYNICDSKNDVLKALNILEHDKELRKLLEELKCEMDFEFNESIADKIDLLKNLHCQQDSKDFKVTSVLKTELIPLQDCFNNLIIRDIINNILNDSNENNYDILNSRIINPEFVGLLRRYAKNKDKRILHEILAMYNIYSSNSAFLIPKSYYSFSKNEIKPSTFATYNPILSYYISYLFVQNNDHICRLGNFRDLKLQYQMISRTLWSNMSQLSQEKYDFMYTEQLYILNCFKIFITEFAESLNINSKDASLEILSENCIESLEKIRKETNLVDPKSKVLQIIENIKECSKGIKTLISETNLNINDRLMTMSDILMQLNYIQLLLNANLPQIDPLAKKALKKKYCLRAIDTFSNMKEGLEMQNSLFSDKDTSLHPYHSHVNILVQNLEEKNVHLGKYVAVRSKDVLYETLVKVIRHSTTFLFGPSLTNIGADNLNIYIDSLLNNTNKYSVAQCKKILQIYDGIAITCQEVVREWSEYKSSYPDIVEPLLSNLTGYQRGLKMKISLLRGQIALHENCKNNKNIQEKLLNLVKMPSLDSNQSTYEQQIKNYTPNLAEFDIDNADKFRLLKCGIQETFNNCIIDSKISDALSKNLFMQFSDLVNSFVSAYNKQQEEIEIKQKEADSLYKTRTKCDDKPEAEQIEDELKELFPEQNDCLAEDEQLNMKTEIEIETENTEAISYDDLKFVVNLHQILLQNFTKSEWLNPIKNKNINHDFVNPLLEKYKTFKKHFEVLMSGLNYKIDSKLLASLNVLLNVVENDGNKNDLSEQMSPVKIMGKSSYDFYKDSNCEEVKSSYHILEELRLKINQLLEEWPNQPTLLQINTVIDRIYGFEITSPIARFLTGFEYLLGKCHEWEQVAHSGVSLSQITPNLTQQIITWRKLELNMWKDLLNRTFEKMNDPIAKWWLYLYNVMRQFILEKRYTTDELIETLQKFMTQSNLAEFQNRLELLHTFHCHAVYLERTKEVDDFINILWNLYNYFSQFSTVVSNKIKDLRSPIEKKLKDYVKIVRWKDINYWTVKETVDKSHKTLHKFVREYKDILSQSVSTYLVNISNINKTENIGIWDRPQRQNPKTYHYTLDAEAYLAKPSFSKKILSSTEDDQIYEGILGKIDSYFSKARKLCKETILATKYPTLIQNLDSFVTDVIEASTHLQNLDVDTTLTKEKQKSQAKNILQQKHRALAELFKTLSKIGLSFRTGIIEGKLKKSSSDFVLKPIDLTANFNHINHGRKEEKILTMWDTCEVYYTRSLMRADVLETALKSPAQDLGIQNIERCKGFTSHLLNLTQKQKSELIESSRTYYYLRFYLKHLTDACGEKEHILSTDIDSLRAVLKNIIILMDQYKIIFNCCPTDDGLNENKIEILLLKPSENQFILQKHDMLWLKVISLISDVVNSTTKLCSSLQKIKGTIPSTEFNIVYPLYVPLNDINVLLDDISIIYIKISELQTLLSKTALSENLEWLLNEINNIKQQITMKETNFNRIEDYKKQVDKYSEKMLLVMQNIYKKYVSLSIDCKTSDKEEGEENSQLLEEHLKNLLIEDLSNDISYLEMKKILKATDKIANILFKCPPSQAVELKAMVNRTLPLLDQLVHLYQYFITQQVSAYRVTCKMNSILLNIFIELASKGFCVPPELSDEMDKEGMSKPSDGLGLGEGKGEKDVSDKIESEDQLDDAQPAGQEKEKEEDQDCTEEDKGIEMSEDFDSKLQDKKKNEEDEDESNSDSDANEQMGETEKGADQLDQEIWGSDKEDANEESGDEEESQEKEEKGNNGEKEGEDQLGAKEKESKAADEDERKDDNSEEEKEKNKKEINEMDEPEYDDEQNDPYHGNQPELPEPEPMDLPDDLKLDDGQENDNETPEENPFDIDTMKDQTAPEDKEGDEENSDKQDDIKNDEVDEFSSDDEDINKKDGDNKNENDDQEEETSEDKGENTESGKDENETEIGEENLESETMEESALDQTQSNQEQVEAMDVDNADVADKAQGTQSETQQSNQPIDELCQEDNPDKDGVGQSQMEESESGHSAQTTAPQERRSLKRDRDDEEIKRQKPGESDNQRSLGDTNEPTKKKLKTIEANNEENGDDKENEVDNEPAEMYQHIKDAKESSTQVLDVATKEQAETQQKEVVNEDNKETEDSTESSNDLPPEEEHKNEEENVDIAKEKSEKLNNKNDKKTKKQHSDGDILEDLQDIDIEGDSIETSTVARPANTTYHTDFTDLKQNFVEKLTLEEISCLREDVEKQLSSWNEPPSSVEAEQAWQKIASVTSSLAQDLSEQLRLVLEPTQASHLKGDFRTGRRINMRKVIPYIASQFRKDKIWLRRTKPSKREYQIVLAIDDSSSMGDNRSKELAFESVALISKALTLLESGQLSVLSFGETTEVLHKLSDQFTDKSGVKLLQKFKFDQNKTCIAKLVDFVTEMFNQVQQTNALNAKLLVIVSDGRGVFSEGETFVRQAVRRAKLSNIFMVFVIIDNPENKNSILDIRMPVFKDGKLLGIQTYMDVFPFSFYIILRDISSLPSVLSDALRQWFELVSNLDKQ